MTPDELDALARLSLEDLDARQPGRRTGSLTGLTTAQAYALQQAVSALRERRGEEVVGYKIGCTSPAIREQLGIREPIFARLFRTGCFPNESRIDHARFAHLAIEGELALLLARDLPCVPPTYEEASEAIASVFPVVELHHYALPAVGNPIAALIASGGMHAGLVLSEQEVKCSGRVPEVSELEVEIDGRVVGLTREPWTMGGPAEALRWLGTRLAESGLSLLRGQVILTGSPLPLFPVGPGSRVAARARPLGRSCVTID